MAAVKYMNYLLLFSCTFLCYVTCDLNLSEDSPCITKGVSGTCVGIFKCNSAAYTYLYTNAGYDKEKEQLPEIPEICSYKNNEPVVCCTDCDIGKETFRNSTIGINGAIVSKEGPVARRKCMEYFQILPYPCRGVGNIANRKTWDEEKKCHMFDYAVGFPVLGGRDARKSEFSHMALLGYGDDVESAQWLCGGSVISEKFILTAGHCISSEALGSISFAAMGLLKRSDGKEDKKIHKIKRILVHPEYKPPSKYNDIALLETETEIQFSKDLLPACLDVELNLPKSQAEASGWGRQGHRQALADILQVVNLEEFSASECAKIYKKHRHLRRGYDHQKQMCYGSKKNLNDTCEGDSGGPLQINEFKCLYTAVGVTSYGKDCGILGSAGMYTRVSYYVPWIESIVWPAETEAHKKLYRQ